MYPVHTFQQKMGRTFRSIFELLKEQQQQNFDTFWHIFSQRLLHSVQLVVACWCCQRTYKSSLSQALWQGLFIAVQPHVRIYLYGLLSKSGFVSLSDCMSLSVYFRKSHLHYYLAKVKCTFFPRAVLLYSISISILLYLFLICLIASVLLVLLKAQCVRSGGTRTWAFWTL